MCENRYSTQFHSCAYTDHDGLQSHPMSNILHLNCGGHAWGPLATPCNLEKQHHVYADPGYDLTDFNRHNLNVTSTPFPWTKD